MLNFYFWNTLTYIYYDLKTRKLPFWIKNSIFWLYDSDIISYFKTKCLLFSHRMVFLDWEKKLFSDLQIIYNFFFNSKNHAFLKFMFYHLQFSVQKYEFSWMKSHQAMFFIIFWHDTYILMAGRTNLVLFSILYKFSKNDAFYAKMSIFGFIFLHEIFFENFIFYFSLILWVIELRKRALLLEF